MVDFSRFAPKNNKKPIIYWFFWVVLIAICFGLAIFAWSNIAPYQAVVVHMFKLPKNEPSKIIDILWFRVNLSTSWLIGAVWWAVMQGFQIGYLLLTESERALDYLIKQSNVKGNYAIKEGDNSELKFAKKRFNALPLSTLTFLKVARTICYTIEFFVGFYSFPLVDGGWWGLLGAIFMFQFNQIKFDNLAMILILMFAVENLVFSGIMIYRLIQLFHKSEAYKHQKATES